jgi:hypothetical protein
VWRALSSNGFRGFHAARNATSRLTGLSPDSVFKIVPNLKRLGLLTPRVRERFAEIGVRQFEDLPDSRPEETVTTPSALARSFAPVMVGGAPPTAGVV